MSSALPSIQRIRQQPALQALAHLPIWACSGGTLPTGKPDKSPRDHRAPWRHGKSNDPSTWGTLDQIEAAAKRYPHLIQHIGIMTGPHVSALDWDYKPHAEQPLIVSTQAALFAHTYQETSLSGRGLRCLFLAPTTTFKKRKYDLEEGVELEIFASHQYAILTGHTTNPAPITDSTTELTQLLNALEPETSKPRPRTPTPRTPYQGNEQTPWDAAAETWDLAELLERNGYFQKGHMRHLAPTSKTGLAGVHLFRDEQGRMRCYSHHASDPLNNGHANDVFDVFTILEHNGDVKAATRAARELLGLTTPRPHNTTATARELWTQHSQPVLDTLMDKLAEAKGHAKSRQKYMDILLALWAAADEGQLTQRHGKTLIEFGGLAALAERMLYRGRLIDLRAGLDYLATIGMIGPVTSTNPQDRFAPLAVEVTADPRHLPALTFQDPLTLQSTSWTTIKRKALGTAKTSLDTMVKKSGTTIVSKCKTPVHDARFTLYWLHRGIRSLDDLARRSRQRKITLTEHLRTLEAEGLIDGLTPIVTRTEATQHYRREVEADPAYRQHRLNYLHGALSFGTRGQAIAAHLRAPKLLARRHATSKLAHDRLTRLENGESCGAVFGVAA